MSKYYNKKYDKYYSENYDDYDYKYSRSKKTYKSKEKLEEERLEKKRLEQEKLEKERLEKEKLEKDAKLRAEIHEKIKNDKDYIARNRIRTNMCKDMINGSCIRGKKCIFAHSKEELRVSICAFKSLCTNPKCNFDHSENAVLPELPSNIDDENTVTDEVIETNLCKKLENLDLKFTIKLEKLSKDDIEKRNKEIFDQKKSMVSYFRDNKEEIMKMYEIIEQTKKQYDISSYSNYPTLTIDQLIEWDAEMSILESSPTITIFNLSEFSESKDLSSEVKNEKNINSSKKKRLMFLECDDEELELLLKTIKKSKIVIN